MFLRYIICVFLICNININNNKIKWRACAYIAFIIVLSIVLVLIGAGLGFQKYKANKQLEDGASSMFTGKTMPVEGIEDNGTNVVYAN